MPRPATATGQSSELLSCRNVTLDRASRTVWVDDMPTSIGQYEFDVLALLMTRPRKVFTYQEINEAVWGGGAKEPERMHQAAMKLRAVLPQGLVLASRGIGYSLEREQRRPESRHPDELVQVQAIGDETVAIASSPEPSDHD